MMLILLFKTALPEGPPYLFQDLKPDLFCFGFDQNFRRWIHVVQIGNRLGDPYGQTIACFEK